jgi:Isoprenylcysteine carboxyl methyltransferase (ICMT) family
VKATVAPAAARTAAGGRKTAQQSSLVCPPSATNAWVAWSGVVAMLLGVTVLNFWQPVHHIAYQALIVMACAAFGVFVPDLLWQKVQRRALVAPAAAGDWPRSLTKLAGLLGSVGFIALLYWLIPEYYRGQRFYGNYWTALDVVLPLWGLLALPYIFWIDRRMHEPHDALWQMGRLVTLRWHGLDGQVLGQYLLGWVVKGFFLPLMFTYLCTELNKLLHYDLGLLHGFMGMYEWTYFVLYFIDLALVAMTYLMSLRLTDTHIRSTEPTTLGWVTALICYQPFWSLIGQQYIDYDSGTRWDLWLKNMPLLAAAWGSAILACVVIYVWATVSFGGRFSNLTNRGIITNGPYRYTKHPAYLAKNLSWWLISMPFMISGDLAMTLRRCLLLGLLNVIYYLRAKTEERHLGMDPVYVQYAAWIDRYGMLRYLNPLPGLGAIARWRPTFQGLTLPVRPFV